MPLIEEREAYIVGFGPPDAPHATWPRSEPWLRLGSAEVTGLVTQHGPGPLWVRQVGTFDLSLPLTLATLS